MNQIPTLVWLFLLFLGLALNLFLFQPYFFTALVPNEQNIAAAGYNIIKCVLILVSGFILAEKMSRSKVFFAVSAICFVEQGVLKSCFLWRDYQVHPDYFPPESTFGTMVLALSAAFAFFVPIILVFCLSGYELRQLTKARAGTRARAKARGKNS